MQIDGKLLGVEVKWTRKPRYLKRPFKTYVLNKDIIPLFIASLIG